MKITPEYNNYVYTVPDSQFFMEIEMIQEWLKHRTVIDEDAMNYLKTALINTLKNGYQITKI